eukprot:4657019-Lingulodinium_polyedra.AAC.1
MHFAAAPHLVILALTSLKLRTAGPGLSASPMRVLATSGLGRAHAQPASTPSPGQRVQRPLA